MLLVSTYDLGRQPFGIASPAAWLRRAGLAVECADTSRDALTDDPLRRASLIAFYLPMHTATRLAGPLIERARTVNPAATIAAYGLYAPLNAAWLRQRGVAHVFGPESEADLLQLAQHGSTATASADLPRLEYIAPDRSGLPAPGRYAELEMPDGSRRMAGSTDASRGCKHLCRHCPIVPVYGGRFRAVPLPVVLADVRAQIAAGARHISFGDPDFFNGPTHARRIVEALAAEWPGTSYDVTIKIEHLIRHADLLPLLAATGCLFVTSAVESVDDEVLARLRKGHTRDDFFRAVALCRAAGLALSPTFVPFTPWTTLEGYLDLLGAIESLDLVDAVAPIQLAIRLLVTAESALLELDDLRARLLPFDHEALVWPWRHPDARVDVLAGEVMRLAGTMRGADRWDVFAAIVSAARGAAGTTAPATHAAGRRGTRAQLPRLTEAWYCCAEPPVEAIASAPASAARDACCAAAPAPAPVAVVRRRGTAAPPQP